MFPVWSLNNEIPQQEDILIYHKELMHLQSSCYDTNQFTKQAIIIKLITHILLFHPKTKNKNRNVIIRLQQEKKT